MGLFKKEACVVCGGKTGMLDKKTSDGKICKECKSKLSPFFDDYKTSFKDILEAQIKQREIDQMMLPTLRFNKIYGDFGAILIDEENKRFAVVADTSKSLLGEHKKIRCAEDVYEFKPDVFRFDQIEKVEIDITQLSHEEKHMVDGEQRSYDPPEYTYGFNFTLEILLDHPYAKRIRFMIDDGDVHIRNVGRRVWTDPGRRLAAHLLDLPGLIIEDQAAVYDNDSLLDWFYHSPYEMPEYSYGFRCSHKNMADIRKYQYYLFMAKQIQESLQWKDKEDK